MSMARSGLVGASNLRLPGEMSFDQSSCVIDWGEFADRLNELRNTLGLSYDTVARNSRRVGHPISHGTVENLCKGKTRPGRRSVEGFLRGCRIGDRDVAAWLDVWHRLAHPGSAPPFRPAFAHSLTEATPETDQARIPLRP